MVSLVLGLSLLASSPRVLTAKEIDGVRARVTGKVVAEQSFAFPGVHEPWVLISSVANGALTVSLFAEGREPLRATFPGVTELNGVAFPVVDASGGRDVVVSTVQKKGTGYVVFQQWHARQSEGNFTRNPKREEALASMLPPGAGVALARDAYLMLVKLEPARCVSTPAPVAVEDQQELVAVPGKAGGFSVVSARDGEVPSWVSVRLQKVLRELPVHCDGGWDRFGDPGCRCVDPVQQLNDALAAVPSEPSFNRLPPTVEVPAGGLELKVRSGTFRVPRGLLECTGDVAVSAALVETKRGLLLLTTASPGPVGEGQEEREQDCVEGLQNEQAAKGEVPERESCAEGSDCARYVPPAPQLQVRAVLVDLPLAH